MNILWITYTFISLKIKECIKYFLSQAHTQAYIFTWTSLYLLTHFSRVKIDILKLKVFYLYSFKKHSFDKLLSNGEKIFCPQIQNVSIFLFFQFNFLLILSVLFHSVCILKSLESRLSLSESCCYTIAWQNYVDSASILKREIF